jgi:DNA polymerase-3 subunit gamma/tau
MAYMASYRKYRPSTFDTVAGQQHIVKTLENALKENKIAHAYLFCGPRGTGKTSMARLFAKALNCEEGFGHQCNHCPNCEAINRGNHPDVIELDAASNRGIDDIRDLINRVKYSPTLGKYKIYIVDEVHMLTVEAFNALLKTLEEPPANVIFILATTEPYKLMPTILSRVQRYDFTRISDKDLLANLKKVCEAESISFDEAALSQIVTLSDGGARDSLSILDQVIAYAGDKIELHHVQELYGLSTTEEKITLVKELNNSNVKFVSEKLDSFISHGTDIKRLTSELIEIIKDLIIYKTTGDGTILKVLKSTDAEEINISKYKLNQILDILMNAYSQYRLVSNINSLLEVAFLKICSLDDNVTYSTPKEEVKPIVKEIVVEKVVEKPLVKQEEKVEPKVEVKAPSLIKGIGDFLESGDAYYPSEEDIINLMLQGNKIEKQRINDSWPKLNQYMVDPSAGRYVNLLSQSFPRIVAKDVLVLETEFNNIANKLSIYANQPGISKIIEEVTGSKFKVIVLTHQNFVNLVQKFSNLRQANKLPTPYPIDIKIGHQE